MSILAKMNIVDMKKVLKNGHYQNLYFLTKKGLTICNDKNFNNFLFNSPSYNINRNKILEILHNHHELTTAQISDKFNLNSVKLYKSLSKLEKEGILEKRVKRESSTFKAYWKIKK